MVEVGNKVRVKFRGKIVPATVCGVDAKRSDLALIGIHEEVAGEEGYMDKSVIKSLLPPGGIGRIGYVFDWFFTKDIKLSK